MTWETNWTRSFNLPIPKPSSAFGHPCFHPEECPHNHLAYQGPRTEAEARKPQYWRGKWETLSIWPPMELKKNSRKVITFNLLDSPHETILWKNDHDVILCCCCFGLGGSRYDILRAISVVLWDVPLLKKSNEILVDNIKCELRYPGHTRWTSDPVSGVTVTLGWSSSKVAASLSPVEVRTLLTI